MKEGLFLDRISSLANGFSKNKAVERTAPIFPYSTNSSFTFLDGASMKAEWAGYGMFILLGIKESLFHGRPPPGGIERLDGEEKLKVIIDKNLVTN